MEMCYDGALVMPSNYVVMDEEEMTYVEGGSGALGAIVSAIAIGGATYGAGQVCGERIYYMGITTRAKWKKYKVPARLLAIRIGGIGPGAVFMLGLENKLYSMCKK